MKNKKMVLGDIIHQRRLELKMTQKELADKLFVSNKAVSKWETYEANPDIGLLLPLAEALEISVDELLNGEVNIVEAEISEVRKKPKKQIFQVIVNYLCFFLFSLIGLFFLFSTFLAFDEQSFIDVNGNTDNQFLIIIFSTALCLLFIYFSVIFFQRLRKYYQTKLSLLSKELSTKITNLGFRFYRLLPKNEKKIVKRKYIKYQLPLILLVIFALLFYLIAIVIKIKPIMYIGSICLSIINTCNLLIMPRRRKKFENEHKIYFSRKSTIREKNENQ